MERKFPITLHQHRVFHFLVQTAHLGKNKHLCPKPLTTEAKARSSGEVEEPHNKGQKLFSSVKSMICSFCFTFGSQKDSVKANTVAVQCVRCSDMEIMFLLIFVGSLQLEGGLKLRSICTGVVTRLCTRNINISSGSINFSLARLGGILRISGFLETQTPTGFWFLRRFLRHKSRSSILSKHDCYKRFWWWEVVR